MPKPRRYKIIGCTKGCSLHDFNLPGVAGIQLHQWYEEGASDATISSRMMSAFDVRVSEGAVGRHRANHLTPEDQLLKLQMTKDPAPETGHMRKEKVTDVELLDQIIAKGAEYINSSMVKITSEQLLRSIELKHKLTQGSIFQNFFEAIGASMEDEEEGEETNAEAIASLDEQMGGDVPEGDE